MPERQTAGEERERGNDGQTGWRRGAPDSFQERNVVRQHFLVMRIELLQCDEVVDVIVAEQVVERRLRASVLVTLSHATTKKKEAGCQAVGTRSFHGARTAFD